MTIKEIEALTGMTRANIRFYEAQGLISPARGENGYRDYSEADLSELQRIKLLRSMELPIEDIRALQSGSADMGETLDRHLLQLEGESYRLDQAQELCMRLRKDHVSYMELDAEKYSVPFTEAPADALPKVRSPIRRYLARILDWAIYSIALNFIMAFGFRMDVTADSLGKSLFFTIITLGLMLLIEPLLLSRFGTTPGKAIVCLRITNAEGGYLSYMEALERTGNVLIYGLGLQIPLLSTGLLIYNYYCCSKDRDLQWEEERFLLTVKDDRARRILYYIGAMAAIFALSALIVLRCSQPLHYGDLTVEEFAENFNHVAKYHNYHDSVRLNPDGSWVEWNGTVISLMGNDVETPDFEYTIEDGHITGISLHARLENYVGYPPSATSECSLATLALVRAQGSFISFGDDTLDVLKQISSHSWDSFSTQCNGVDISYRMELEGYETVNDFLLPIEGEKQSCVIDFELKSAD